MTVNWNFISKVYEWLNINLFADCLLCGLPAGHADGLCRPCLRDLPWLAGPLCGCGLPRRPGQPCRDCLASRLPVTRIRPCLQYTFPTDSLLNQYKHRFDHACERALERIWCQQLATVGAADGLVPVPLHWQRHFSRGFNQAHRLAAALSRQTGIPVLPILQRQKAAPSQQGLGRRQRSTNLASAFRCTGPAADKHLVLVDDVVTTGSTVGACALALQDAGAASVQVWCLARTLPATPQG